MSRFKFEAEITTNIDTSNYITKPQGDLLYHNENQEINMNNNKITNLQSGTNDNDAVNVQQLKAMPVLKMHTGIVGTNGYVCSIELHKIIPHQLYVIDDAELQSILHKIFIDTGNSTEEIMVSDTHNQKPFILYYETLDGSTPVSVIPPVPPVPTQSVSTQAPSVPTETYFVIPIPNELGAGSQIIEIRNLPDSIKINEKYEIRKGVLYERKVNPSHSPNTPNTYNWKPDSNWSGLFLVENGKRLKGKRIVVEKEIVVMQKVVNGKLKQYSFTNLVESPPHSWKNIPAFEGYTIWT